MILGSWYRARRQHALYAALVSTLTGALAITLGSDTLIAGALLYWFVSFVAVFFPAAIAAQVVVGQLLVAGVLVGQGVALPVLLPLVGGVVATAELLTVVARLDSPIEIHPGDVLPRAGVAAVIGAAVFGVVVLLAGVPGPEGLLAVALAAAALVAVASRLGDPSPGEPS